MSRYTLSINITSDNRELLESLLVTLETANGDISELDMVELYTSTGDAQSTQAKGLDNHATPTSMQRNLFLDQWCLS